MKVYALSGLGVAAMIIAPLALRLLVMSTHKRKLSNEEKGDA